MRAGTKVLVIADQEDVRRDLRSFLLNRGHQVANADSSPDAVSLLSGEQVDIVLTSLSLSNGDGLRFIATIKKHDPTTPVIVIGSGERLRDAIEMFRAGAWDYLVEPIEDPAALQDAINRALERQSALQRAREHRDPLEKQVRQCAADLQAANKAIEKKTIALREVLDTVQSQRRETIQSIISHLKRNVFPLLQRLRDLGAPGSGAIIDHIMEQLRQVCPAAGDPLRRLADHLTPTELRICRLIRQEMSSKQIARAEGVSQETVESHRRNIRRKLKINNERVNLATYLQSLAELDEPSYQPTGPQPVSGMPAIPLLSPASRMKPR